MLNNILCLLNVKIQVILQLIYVNSKHQFMEAMIQFMQQNMKYPKDAQKRKKQGRVLVTFVVEKDGSVSNAVVVKSVWPSLDAEALRVVRAMPKWAPGKQNGKVVRVKFTMPFNFAL